MGDIKFRIPYPKLVLGQSFQVFYGLKGSSLTNYGFVTDNDFHTISGLDPGEYVLRICFISGNEDCDPSCIDQCFVVKNDCPCPTISDVKIEKDIDGITYISALLTFDEGFPPCGFTVTVVNLNASPGVGGFTLRINSINELIPFTPPNQFLFKRNANGTDFSITFESNCCDSPTSPSSSS